MKTKHTRQADFQRIIRLAVLSAASVALTFSAQSAPTKPTFPAVPGESVGRVRLGDTQAQVRAKMGKPSDWTKFSKTLAADAWLGPEPKAWSSEEQRFFIVTYQNGRVAQIEFNGPEFVTSRGISIQSTLRQFRAKHPNLRTRAYLYRYEGGGGHIEYYYDDVRGGIAFQFGTQDNFDERVLPQSLRVHRRGVPVIIAPGGEPTKAADELPVGISK